MTISVIGCGPTAEGWHNTPCDLSIGCNDCARFGKDTDWLVVVNRRFPSEREDFIIHSNPKRFFTTIYYWNKLFSHAETLRLQRFSKHVKKGHVYSSKTSPFVALSLAFNAGAKDVILFGVDLVSHPVIKDKLRDYELRQFERFCREIAKQGCQTWVSSKDSSLSKFLPVWKKSSVNFCSNFNFKYQLDDLPCAELENHIRTIKLEPSTGKEYIIQVEKQEDNPVYDIGEVEVVKNDGKELVLQGTNFTASVDLTHASTEIFWGFKIGDKFKAVATHE